MPFDRAEMKFNDDDKDSGGGGDPEDNDNILNKSDENTGGVPT